MKKIFTAFMACVLCVTVFAFGASAQETENNPKLTDSANSWRYENGQIITDPYGVSLLADDPYHPDATLTGIDVSKHQGVINWEKVKAAGIDFAIIRCGYAEDKTEYDDPRWEYNASECERLGIPYGVYLYSYAFNTAEAESEADHVLRLLKGHTPSLPIYYDMEDNSTLPYDHVAMANAFCRKISDAGYPVGIYASKYWWTTYLNDPSLDRWYRWVAQWGSSCTYNGRYEIWQYYNKGRVDGISTDVDMNFLIGYPDDHGVVPGTKLKAETAPNGAPKLSWTALSGAENYVVYISQQSDGDYYPVDVNGTTYIDYSAKPGTTCYYKVKAVYPNGSQSGSSNVAKVSVKLAAPSASLSNEADSGKPKLVWNSIHCADKYEVYRKTGSDGKYALQATVAKTTFTDTSATAGKTYYYKVRAVYGDMKSSYSSEKNIVCDLPRVKLKSSEFLMGDQIRFSWNYVSNATGYDIYCSTDGEDGYTLVDTVLTASYIGPHIVNGKSCCYKVVAKHSNKNAYSAFSRPVGKDAAGSLPLKLINISASGQNRFTWQKVSGASAYEIYCSTRENSGYKLIGTTTAEAFSNTAAEDGRTLYYMIKAVRYKKDTYELLSYRLK